MNEPLFITQKDFDVLKYRLSSKNIIYNKLVYIERMDDILKQISSLAKVPIKDLEAAYMKEVRDEFRFACFCINVTKALDLGSRYPWQRIQLSGIRIFKLWGLDMLEYVLGSIINSFILFLVVALIIPTQYFWLFLIVNGILFACDQHFNIFQLGINIYQGHEVKFINKLIDKDLGGTEHD